MLIFVISSLVHGCNKVNPMQCNVVLQSVVNVCTYTLENYFFRKKTSSTLMECVDVLVVLNAQNRQRIQI